MSCLIRVLLAPAVGVMASDPRYDDLSPVLEWLGQAMMDPADPLHCGALVGGEPPARPRPPDASTRARAFVRRSCAERVEVP